ncbi:pathogenesis-related protein 1B [Elaeis guineensis]|uniref:Pathogenesis-related protein 1B n=1 Tax=Elaeis guineensis var. tenera TaxID=51953 RepID=A0A6I9SIK3_ELAGV|nr:pathogenesis-related protein 1B [Elaeis guineensis]
MGFSSNLALALATIIAICLSITNPSVAQNSPQDYLQPHNAARRAVGVGPMTWDNTLARYALNYANTRTGDCRLVHSRGPYGENLYMSSPSIATAARAVGAWVDERRFYDYRTNTCARGKVCGHYTQVVWRDSVRVGCARVRCNNGNYFIICSYNPPGNISGRRPYLSDAEEALEGQEATEVEDGAQALSFK